MADAYPVPLEFGVCPNPGGEPGARTPTQQEYYQALHDSAKQADSAPFIEFMLTMIREAVAGVATPQDAPQVAPQVANLLRALAKVKTTTRDELQQALGLRDRKSFRERYLAPALAEGLIEMTRPEKPNSRNQQYRLTVKGGLAVQIS